MGENYKNKSEMCVGGNDKEAILVFPLWGLINVVINMIIWYV